MISHDSIGDKGRNVRCAKCGHQWFQKSEKDALDDLIARIQSEEIDDIAFSEGKYGQPKQEPSKEGDKSIPLLEFIKSKFFTLEKRYPILYVLTSKPFAGFISALAVFLVLVNVAIYARVTICAILPSLEKVYEVAGYDVDIIADLTSDEAFAVEHLAIHLPDNKTDKSIIVTGTLINLTSESVYIPAFGLRFLGKNGQDIGEPQIAMLSQTVLEKESTIPLSIRLEDGLPEGTAALDMQFVPEAEAKKHIKSYPSPDQVHTAYEEE